MKKNIIIAIFTFSFAFCGELIFQCDFSENEAGLYTWEQVKNDWKNPKGESPSWNNGIGFNGEKGRPQDSARARIEENISGQKKVLAVLYPQKQVQSQNSGVQWQYNLGKNYDSATVEYKVFFPEGGDYGTGGKLPGFDGGTMPSGCVSMSKADGFSARVMWRSGSALSDAENIYATQYMYYRDKKESCGDDFYWGKLPENLEISDPQLYNACNRDYWSVIKTSYGNAWPCSYWGKLKPYIAHFEIGKWNTVRTYIKMNDADKTEANKSNSVIKTWLNDVLVLDLRGLVLRDSDDFGIDAFYFSTFAGGSTVDFAPQTKDQTFYFDDFKIWEGEKPTSEKENNEGDELEENRENTAISAKTKKKVEPTILLNNRQISIYLENSKTMKISGFSVNGRKLFHKNVSGDKISFTIPKSAKNAIIVQIDSDGRFYSKKVAIN
ncbi:MAG: hypothetical protein FWF51_00150 [Chitinivibrionia bacterium]|nr:hypothetical protein [Chitinivibrionia bacterium]